MAAHPGVTVNLGTRVRPFDFASEGFDAALHFGVENWSGAGYQKLFDERMMACCAPDFLLRNQIEQPADLMRLPLLQLETRPHAWSVWFARKGVAARAPQGMFFDQFAPMMQSAIYGLGVALLPMFLARPELAEGRLVAAWGPPEPGDGSYYLVWPETAAGYLPLVAFREWLATEIARDPPDGEEPDILPR
jgi:DNA-binding transcriptional LysR family regulator